MIGSLVGLCTGTGSYNSAKEGRKVSQVFIASKKLTIAVEVPDCDQFEEGQKLIAFGDIGVYERSLFIKDAFVRQFEPASDGMLLDMLPSSVAEEA